MHSALPGIPSAIASFAAGQTIFTEGDTGRDMFIVLAGGVRVLKCWGENTIEIGRIGVGGIFGELALVEDLTRSASIVAAEEGAQVLAVDQARFVHLISQQPAFALYVIRKLGRRINELNRTLEEVTGRPGTHDEQQ